VPALDREFGDRRALLHPGVVDEDVDGPRAGLDRRDAGLDRLLVGDVEGRDRGLAAGGGQGLVRSLELAPVAAVQYDMSAGFGEAFSQCEPDALAGAGDQCDLAFQAEQRQRHGVSSLKAGVRRWFCLRREHSFR